MACQCPPEEQVLIEEIEPYKKVRCGVCEKLWWLWDDETGHYKVEG